MIERLCADSRRCAPGVAFLAYPGESADGRRYIGDALARGSSAVLWESDGFAWNQAWRVPNIAVQGLKAAAGSLAHEFYGRPSESLWTCGVTGTNGKTSCSQWIAASLRARGMQTGVIGTLGSGFPGALCAESNTTPDALELHRRLAELRRDGAQAVVMEASSHGLVQGRLNGVAFDCALFTNLSQDHLDLHATMEDYFDAKRRLFTPEHARHAVVNADDPWGRRLLEDPAIATTSYGIDAAADVRADDVSVDAGGATVVIGGVSVRTALRGRFNVENVLAALAAAQVVGIGLDVGARGVGEVQRVPGRMEPVDAGQDFTVVVDYAHTPDSIHSVLRGARGSAEGRVIVVFGCGGDRDRAKRPMMGRTAAEDADLVIVTNDNPRTEDPLAIIDEITSGIPDGAAAIVEPDRAAAIERAIEAARPGDVVVVAGKGHETTQEIDGVFVPFDDREVARAALARRSSG